MTDVVTDMMQWRLAHGREMPPIVTELEPQQALMPGDPHPFASVEEGVEMAASAMGIDAPCIVRVPSYGYALQRVSGQTNEYAVGLEGLRDFESNFMRIDRSLPEKNQVAAKDIAGLAYGVYSLVRMMAPLRWQEDEALMKEYKFFEKKYLAEASQHTTVDAVGAIAGRAAAGQALWTVTENAREIFGDEIVRRARLGSLLKNQVTVGEDFRRHMNPRQIVPLLGLVSTNPLAE